MVLARHEVVELAVKVSHVMSHVTVVIAVVIIMPLMVSPVPFLLRIQVVFELLNFF